MNLHAIVSPAIATVNPFQQFTIKTSTGYTTNPDGSRVPTYATSVASGQMQALTYKDLQHLDGLNLNGVQRAIYFTGEVDAIIRAAGKGGDVITDTNGNVYLVTQVLEQWDEGSSGPSWVKVAVTLQNGS